MGYFFPDQAVAYFMGVWYSLFGKKLKIEGYYGHLNFFIFCLVQIMVWRNIVMIAMPMYAING